MLLIKMLLNFLHDAAAISDFLLAHYLSLLAAHKCALSWILASFVNARPTVIGNVDFILFKKSEESRSSHHKNGLFKPCWM